jgi:ABC-2 type transport system ATP-binding protein
MTTTPTIEITDLHKSYGEYTVLRGLNLRVQGGETYGLMGQNGAGKTTLIHVLLGLLRPNRGRVRVLGVSPEQAHGRLGYLPERLRYHLRYSAREYLRFLGHFDDLPRTALYDRVDQLLALVELSESADRLMTTYSKGMLQRVGVAQALLSDPDLLLIDEPTSGLDPAGQHEVIDILNEVRGRGHTILLCTHYVTEVERLCDRVGILSAGRLGTEVNVESLRTPGASVAIRVSGLRGELRSTLHALGPAIECRDERVLIRPNTPELQAQVLRVLLDGNATVIALEPLESPLEELFARATAEPSAAPASDAPPSSGSTILGRPLPTPTFSVPETPTAADGEAKAADAPPPEGDALLRDLLRRKEESAE